MDDMSKLEAELAALQNADASDVVAGNVTVADSAVQAQEAPAAVQTKPAAPSYTTGMTSLAQMMNDCNFSASELSQITAYADQINLKDNKDILQYGTSCQKKLTDFSETALNNIKTKEMGAVGDMLTNVVVELKSFDATEEEKKGFFGFFKKQGDKIEEMKTRYNKVETNVDKIADSLESHQVTLLKDIAVLDKMYELNSAYFRELTLYIAAGKKKLEETRAGEVAELIAKAQATGLQEDAQAAKDLEDQCDRLEKKIYDLELTRTISMQMGPQIRLIQNSDTQMVEKIQSTIVNTIPLWKSQMVLALGMEHANQAAKAQEAVTNLTNSLLKKNAEQLHMASVESAKQAERGIVDIETLTQTNQQLISTLDEVMRIQNEGHEKRVAAEGELANIERELKDKLLEIAKS